MRYCDCYDLHLGMVLAHALYSETNELLLSRGYVLDEALIGRIRHLGISPVCVEEEGTEDIIIEEIAPESARLAANGSLKAVFDEVVQATKDRMEAGLDSFWPSLKPMGFALPLENVKKAVSTLIEELLDNMATEWTTLPLKFVTGSYFRHGVDVALLSLLMGIHFQFRFKDLKYLGLGAMLHDIGKTLAPNILEKKNFDFSPDDQIQYRRHPEYGLRLLEGQPEGLYIEKECIHQHHEQPDGGGFPRGLRGSQTPPSPRSNPNPQEIFRLAEIVHVADAYLNLTTGGWLPKALDPENAVSEILRHTPKAYNPHIVSALLQVVVRFPRGAKVRILKNSSQSYIGFRGVVAAPNPAEPHKPRVVIIENRFGERIKPKTVDFSQEKTMQICLEV